MKQETVYRNVELLIEGLKPMIGSLSNVIFEKEMLSQGKWDLYINFLNNYLDPIDAYTDDSLVIGLLSLFILLEAKKEENKDKLTDMGFLTIQEESEENETFLQSFYMGIFNNIMRIKEGDIEHFDILYPKIRSFAIRCQTNLLNVVEMAKADDRQFTVEDLEAYSVFSLIVEITPILFKFIVSDFSLPSLEEYKEEFNEFIE